MYDKPISDTLETNDESDSQLSASELRKLRNKQRKAQLKAKKENEKSQKKNNEKRDNESKSEFAEVVDVNKLEKSVTPLEDVMRFLTPFKFFGYQSLDTHLLAFEIYFRKGKLLLQLQSLKRASRLSTPNSKFYPTLVRQCCLFLHSLIVNFEQLNESIRFVLRQEFPTLKIFGMENIDGDQVNLLSKLPTTDEFIQKHLSPTSKSFRIRVEHLKVKHYLTEWNNSSSNVFSVSKLRPANEYTESMISSLVSDIEHLSELTLESSLSFYNSVKSNAFGQISAPTLEKLRLKLHLLYPYASRFMIENELQELENELVDSDYFTAETEEYTSITNATDE